MINNCKKSSNKSEFWLYDDCNKQEIPAYIEEKEKENHIAIVKNPQKKNIDFIAIDYCIPLKRKNGKDAKKCDGLIINTADEAAIFVELKNRKGKKNRNWKKKGYEQLKETIELYEMPQDIAFKIKKAYICNKQYPRDNENNNGKREKFREETGYYLYIKNTIDFNENLTTENTTSTAEDTR